MPDNGVLHGIEMLHPKYLDIIIKIHGVLVKYSILLIKILPASSWYLLQHPFIFCHLQERV